MTNENPDSLWARLAARKKEALRRKIEAAHAAGLTPEQSTRLEDGTEAELAAQAEEILNEEPEPEPNAEQLAISDQSVRAREAYEEIFPPRRHEP
jgi:hypothetical protein